MIIQAAHDPQWVRYIPIVGQMITAVGIAAIGLWRYYELAKIDIRERAEKSGQHP